jgi:hypothetical protein
MLYFADYFSGLVAKSSKFYQEHKAIQQRAAQNILEPTRDCALCFSPRRSPPSRPRYAQDL